MNATTATTTGTPTLQTVMLNEAVEMVWDLDDRWGIVPPAAHEELRGDLQTLLTVAGGFTVATKTGNTAAIDNVGQLVTHQKQLIAALSGVATKHVTDDLVTEEATPVHHWRNLVLVVVIAAAASYRSSTAAIDELVKGAPRLTTCTISERRPFTDVEVLLMRSYVAATYRPGDRSASVYALVDAGMTPGETTKVTLDDIDDIDDLDELDDLEYSSVPYIHAPGNEHVVARYLGLDRFGKRVLGAHNRHAFSGQRRPPMTAQLTYIPRKNLPGSKEATSSAQNVISNLLKHLGLWHADTTASSLTQWRIQSEWKSHGTELALEVSGRHSLPQMCEALKVEPAAVRRTAPGRGDFNVPD